MGTRLPGLRAGRLPMIGTNSARSVTNVATAFIATASRAFPAAVLAADAVRCRGHRLHDVFHWHRHSVSMFEQFRNSLDRLPQPDVLGDQNVQGREKLGPMSRVTLG